MKEPSVTWLLSPTEKKLANKLGDKAIISPLPEEKGADVLVYTRAGLLGTQRKEVPHDFLASVVDGRFARSLSLLPKSCKFPLFIREGKFRYFPNTHVALGTREPSKFTKANVCGMLFDIVFAAGVPVIDTDDIDDTIYVIDRLATYLNRTTHLSIYSRPSAKGVWYVPTAREIDLWILQSFPGIGPALADAIVKHFGDKIPLKWTCTEQELAEVPRLTEKRAHIMYNTLLGKDVMFVSSSKKQPEQQTSIFDKLRSKIHVNNK